jgi:hypothetical protein
MPVIISLQGRHVNGLENRAGCMSLETHLPKAF